MTNCERGRGGRRVRRRRLSLEIAKERLAFLLGNGPALENDVALNLRALEIMERFSLPSAYDAQYPAPAESRAMRVLDG